MSRDKFEADLKKGEAGERHVAFALKRHYGAKGVSKIGKGKTFDFTLVFPDFVERYEVKTDFRAAKTGNLFFEYSCSNKNSGLLVTEADKWAILIPHLQEILVASPKALWEYLSTSKHRNLKGGDRCAVQGYIVPIQVVRELPFIEVISTKTRLT